VRISLSMRGMSQRLRRFVLGFHLGGILETQMLVRFLGFLLLPLIVAFKDVPHATLVDGK